MPELKEPELDRPTSRPVDGVSSSGSSAGGKDPLAQLGYKEPDPLADMGYQHPDEPEPGQVPTSDTDEIHDAQSEANQQAPEPSAGSGYNQSQLFPLAGASTLPSQNTSPKAAGSQLKNVLPNPHNPGDTGAAKSSLPKTPSVGNKNGEGVTGTANDVKDIAKGISNVKNAAGTGPVGLAIAGAVEVLKNKDAIIRVGKKGIKVLFIYWLVGILAFGILLAVIGFVISRNFAKHGDSPVPATALKNLTTEQIFETCPQISPTVQRVNPVTGGSPVKLQLNATVGRFSDELSISASGGIDKMSMGAQYAQAAQKDPSFAQLATKYPGYYVAARFPYNAYTYADQLQPNPTKKVTDKNLLASLGVAITPSSYVGARIAFINPTTGKGVIGFALDWGPSPHALGHMVDADAEAALWKSSQESGFLTGWRISDPVGTQSRIGGGPTGSPDTLGGKIDASSDTPIIMAYATDQNLTPGTTFTCSGVTGIGGNDVDGDGNTGSVTATGTLPADKGVCDFCVQKPLPYNQPGQNSTYGQPTAIILHYLGTKGMTLDGAWTYFDHTMTASDTSGRKYVQFAVGQNGTIDQFLPETKEAAGALNFNAFNGGITVSIENEGNFESSDPSQQYTQAQLQADIKLVKYLMSKYGIGVKDLISHKEADCRAGNPPGRRSDPGTVFMHAVLSAVGGDQSANQAEEQACDAR